MGTYLNSDPMPEKKIAELPPDEYRRLLRSLVAEEIFPVRERIVALLNQNSTDQGLDLVFQELYVAYELFLRHLFGIRERRCHGIAMRVHRLSSQMTTV